MDHITSTLPATLDPIQIAYHPNRSTDDAFAITLNIALSGLDKRNTYVRMLFSDYSSAFNTIVPSKLIIKVEALGLNPTRCNWILDFLMSRPQVEKVGNNISTLQTLNTGAPQGCMLSLFLYSLNTHDCVALQISNSIIKFADNCSGFDYQQRRDSLQGGAEGTRSVVSGKQPLTQRQQNKGDDR